MKKTIVLVCAAIGAAVLIQTAVTQVQAQFRLPEPVGSWYGVARPVNPATSPFPEVIMEPTFFRDGNLIANDSHELTNPHSTSHGSWTKTGPDTLHATFVWLNQSPTKPNGYLGASKVVLEGQIDAVDPNKMLGTIQAFLYPEGTNPLDTALKCVPFNPTAPPAANTCYDLGVFRIAQLQRINP